MLQLLLTERIMMILLNIDFINICQPPTQSVCHLNSLYHLNQLYIFQAPWIMCLQWNLLIIKRWRQQPCWLQSQLWSSFRMHFY